MKKINWIRKLTSRKMWMSIASFVSMLIVAFGGSESQATKISALIVAGATAISYIVGEGLIDYASLNENSDISNEPEENLDRDTSIKNKC